MEDFLKVFTNSIKYGMYIKKSAVKARTRFIAKEELGFDIFILGQRAENLTEYYASSRKS